MSLLCPKTGNERRAVNLWLKINLNFHDPIKLRRQDLPWESISCLIFVNIHAIPSGVHVVLRKWNIEFPVIASFQMVRLIRGRLGANANGTLGRLCPDEFIKA